MRGWVEPTRWLLLNFTTETCPCLRLRIGKMFYPAKCAEFGLEEVVETSERSVTIEGRFNRQTERNVRRVVDVDSGRFEHLVTRPLND